MFNGMNGLEILKNWPRFDDGEPVEFGDEFQNAHGGASVLRTVIIKDCRDSLGGDFYWKLGRGKNAVTLKGGERVERPAPKVLDADGVEIRVGDEVWDVDGSGPFIVSGFVGEPLAVIFEIAERNDLPRKPSQLTHRAPVLAADGEPLEVGQMVYHIADGKEYTVEELFKDGAMVTHDGITGGRCRAEYLTHQRPVLGADGVPLREGETVWDKQTGRSATVKGFDRMLGEPCAVIDFAGIEQRVSGKLLTHERPESWERIEEDLGDEMAKQQCGPISPELACKLAGEFVRRARALAGDA